MSKSGISKDFIDQPGMRRSQGRAQQYCSKDLLDYLLDSLFILQRLFKGRQDIFVQLPSSGYCWSGCQAIRFCREVLFARRSVISSLNSEDQTSSDCREWHYFFASFYGLFFNIVLVFEKFLIFSMRSFILLASSSSIEFQVNPQQIIPLLISRFCTISLFNDFFLQLLSQASTILYTISMSSGLYRFSLLFMAEFMYFSPRLKMEQNLFLTQFQDLNKSICTFLLWLVKSTPICSPWCCGG